MSKLGQLLKEQIKSSGPLSVHDFMETALGHPQFGYYQQSDPFGAKGDFVTAPEVSQMFGELIGLWCVDCWSKLGAPDTIHLVELGPGKGTLMSDALRSAALVPEFINAVNIHMVETSERLREIQKNSLPDFNVTWHSALPSLGSAPVLVIANEFFDALSIHQYECRDGQWLERQVALSEDTFVFTTNASPSDWQSTNLPDPKTQETGTFAEINPTADQIVSEIAKTLKQNGGSALIIDYGYLENELGDSLQAVQKHKYISPLSEPGTVDITAHVNFASLATAAEKQGCTNLAPATQARFLERLGIEARALLLSRNATEDQKEKVSGELRRLISPEEMGTLFKALSFYHNMSAPPAGFGE